MNANSRLEIAAAAEFASESDRIRPELLSIVDSSSLRLGPSKASESWQSSESSESSEASIVSFDVFALRA